METTMTAGYPCKKRTEGLSHLVKQLAISSTPAALKRGSFIVNDVPGDMNIAADENMLASVVGGMLNTVVNHAENSCIRIDARTHGNIVLVEVKDSSSINSYAVASGIQKFQPMAEKMGGYLCITSQHEKMMTIAFSFPISAQ